jgi:hypothetical protein
MTKQELSNLPKGTTLFALSRKVSRSGMREVFDVFFPTEDRTRLYWVRISPEDAREFHKRAECHAGTCIADDVRIGGSFYVNGCGFDRAGAVIESLSTWATGDPQYFRKERV